MTATIPRRAAADGFTSGTALQAPLVPTSHLSPEAAVELASKIAVYVIDGALRPEHGLAWHGRLTADRHYAAADILLRAVAQVERPGARERHVQKGAR